MVFISVQPDLHQSCMHRPMLKKLASLYVAFWTITALILWLGLGALLATKGGPFFQVFKALNDEMIFTWLTTRALHCPVILVWFSGLCLITVVLFLNTCLCTWQRILPMFQASKWSRNLLAMIHILVIVVILGHGLSLVVGDKYPAILMFPGQTREMGDGYALRMDALHFGDDPALLRLSPEEKHQKMTREAVHIHQNHVMLTLMRDGQVMARSRAGVLAPFDHGPVRIILKKFVWPRQENRLGAMILMVRNPLATPFFVIYALMILCLGWYVLMTWKRPVQGHHEENEYTESNKGERVCH